jgi:ATP-dependent DNA helicase RecQ
MDGDAASEEETSLMVRKALSAVARVDRRYGLTAAVKLLAGAPDPRLERAGLDRTPTYGSLREHSEPWLTQLLRRCVTAGWVDFTPGDKPVVLLTGSGRAVMKGDRPARLVLPREDAFAGGGPRRGQRGPGAATRAAWGGLGAGPGAKAGRAGSVEGAGIGAGGGPTGRGADREPDVLPAEASSLFEALRALRTQLAREDSVPAYVVASDRTLRDIALLRPRGIESLKLAHGIGPAKAERYGARILEVVARAAPAP